MFKITKREGIFYVSIFVILFLGGLTLMALDNGFWISASPEWDSAHEVCNNLKCWTGAVQNYSISGQIDYFLKYRIYTVFTHPRDLLAVGIYSFLLTLLIIFGREILFKGKLIKNIGNWLG